MYRIIQKRRWFLTISVVLSVISLAAFFIFGLKLGVDFTGGTQMELQFASALPSNDTIIQTLAPLNLGETRVLPSGQTIVLRTRTITNDERQAVLDALGPLAEGGVTEQSFTAIGPSIGQELRQKAYVAIVLVLIAIILYVSWAFRKVSKGPVPSWVFGSAAVVALIHDVLLVVGLFVLFGRVLGTEVDSLFVTALLTVLGFSVHDTIVVFDRIREGIRRHADLPFEDIINRSINETLARSINTSMTALIVLTSLAVVGGETIRMFVIALICGIIFGTYSSIFIASPLLLIWYSRKRR
jgi:preprotein translocase subunit SecF